MKRIFLLSLTLLLVLTLTACGNADATPETTMPNAAATTQPTMAATEATVAVTTEATEATTVATTEATEATTVATTEATTVATEPPTEPPVPETEAPTQPEHSWLYIPGVSVEDVIRYFNEVCLDAEYVSGGDPSKLQKWMEPIYYTLDGPYTDEDLETLTGFMEFLNTIDGFPGIYESQDLLQTNLQIYFRTQDGLVDLTDDVLVDLVGNNADVYFLWLPAFLQGIDTTVVTKTQGSVFRCCKEAHRMLGVIGQLFGCSSVNVCFEHIERTLLFA